VEKLEQAKQAIFAGKMSDPQPKLFMSMGGAGSGKTAVEEIAAAHCGDNFVITSLDEFRKISDLYQVLTAASHHSDDYVYVEPFANRLRSLSPNTRLLTVSISCTTVPAFRTTRDTTTSSNNSKQPGSKPRLPPSMRFW
jgi:hypothetical protein